MLEHLSDENNLSVVLGRILGTIFQLIGFSFVGEPIVAMATYIPFIGGAASALGSFAVATIAVGITAVVAPLCIFTGWTAARVESLGYETFITGRELPMVTKDNPFLESLLAKMLARDAFASADTDGNGVLDAQEIQDLIRKELGKELSMKQICDLMEKYDEDGDYGTLTYKEYYHMLRNWQVDGIAFE